MKDDAAQEKFRALCSAHNCKFTAQRFAVYNCICGNVSHPSVDQIWNTVRKGIASITRESVFRILTELAQWGVVTRMDKITNARFDGVAGDHGHLICTECGTISDFQLPSELKLPDAATGFEADHVELRVSGICRKCAAKLQKSK